MKPKAAHSRKSAGRRAHPPDRDSRKMVARKAAPAKKSGALGAYRAKRDFKQTAEPRGSVE